jgi:hypothetical protein
VERVRGAANVPPSVLVRVTHVHDVHARGEIRTLVGAA